MDWKSFLFCRKRFGLFAEILFAGKRGLDRRSVFMPPADERTNCLPIGRHLVPLSGIFGTVISNFFAFPSDVMAILSRFTNRYRILELLY